MKMKRFMALLLALVLTFALAAPAFAAESDDGSSVESPRYAVQSVPYRKYIGGLTFAVMDFTVAYKGGRYVFESLDSVSFDPVDTIAVHWDLVSYSYQLSNTECIIDATRREMIGDTATGFSDTATIKVGIEEVMGSAKGNDPAVLSSVYVVIDETYGFAGEPVPVLTE